MRKVMTTMALVAILAMVTTASFAYDKECKKSKGSECRVDKKAHMLLKNQDELGLSDAQVKQIKEIMLVSKKGKIKQSAEIEIIVLDIKSAMCEDDVDTKAINALIDKKYELKKVAAKSSIAAYAELKSILTEKQRDKLKDLWKKCKKETTQGTTMKGEKGEMKGSRMSGKR